MGSTRLILAHIQAFNSREETPHTEEQTLFGFPKMEGNFLITGAAQGFGKEFTRRVLKSGGRVLLSDKNPVGGEETNKAFQEEFGVDRCSFEEADVSSKPDWEKLWSRLILIIMMIVDTQRSSEIIRDAKGCYSQGVN